MEEFLLVKHRTWLSNEIVCIYYVTVDDCWAPVSFIIALSWYGDDMHENKWSEKKEMFRLGRLANENAACCSQNY